MTKWGIIFLVASLLFLQIRLWSGERSFAEIAFLEDTIKFKNIEIRAQVIQNEVLISQVEDLISSNETIEELSRSELMLIKSGEIFVVITDD